MAKKRSGGVNKSQELRDYLGRHPGATASEIVPTFARRGIEITPSLINWVKAELKQKAEADGSPAAPVQDAPAKKKTVKRKLARKKTKARKKSKANKIVPLTGTSSRQGALTADHLLEAKKLVDELGGIDQARRALKYLEDLG